MKIGRLGLSRVRTSGTNLAVSRYQVPKPYLGEAQRPGRTLPGRFSTGLITRSGAVRQPVLSVARESRCAPASHNAFEGDCAGSQQRHGNGHTEEKKVEFPSGSPC